MFKHSVKIRLLAVFVVAFICLNAGGAVCVAYCRTSDTAGLEAEHCPLKKVERHCDRSGEDTEPQAFQSNEIDCCPMTISFFGAPIDKPTFRYEPAVAVVTTKAEIAPLANAVSSVINSISNYRGPPPLDRRPDRIKHRLLRI